VLKGLSFGVDMDRLRLDIVQAWRWMRARPGAALAIVLILALGVGLITAMFALADPFILRPLPHLRPEELAAIRMRVDRDSTLAPDMLRTQNPQLPTGGCAPTCLQDSAHFGRVVTLFEYVYRKGRRYELRS
jgi:hypothetical protein